MEQGHTSLETGNFLARTSVMACLVQVKNLVRTHGPESSKALWMKLWKEASYSQGQKGFGPNPPSLFKVNLLKKILATPEYQETTEALQNRVGHNKLTKLFELLKVFFEMETQGRNSKTIIFTQFRESAKEIKDYIDRQMEIKDCKGLIKADIFLGASGKEMTQKGQK